MIAGKSFFRGPSYSTWAGLGFFDSKSIFVLKFTIKFTKTFESSDAFCFTQAKKRPLLQNLKQKQWIHRL